MPEATVHEIDGQLVLVDPQAVAVLKAVGQYNCRASFEINQERINYFAERSRLQPPGSVVIVILNMDDPVGALLGDALMPGYDWDAIRAQGQIPFARGLAERFGVADFIAEYDIEALSQLEALDPIPTDYKSSLPVVVIDHGVIAVFPANMGAPKKQRTVR